MDYRSLEVFVWVATLGSFRGAAARLNTTQPAVSQRIAALEADLGAVLLDRTRSRVSLTERGRVLLAGAERLLAQTAALRAEVGDRDALRGSLRLGVSETVVHTLLPVFLERVARRYPKLAIEVEVDITPVLAERLVGHELDLAFLLGPLPESGMRNLPLCRFPVCFLASPALGLRDRVRRLEDLAGQALVTFSRRARPYAELVERLSGLEPKPRVHASASLATVIRMATDGLGIAAVPVAIAEREIAAGRLEILPLPSGLPDLAFTASWPASPAAFLPEALAILAVETAAALA